MIRVCLIALACLSACAPPPRISEAASTETAIVLLVHNPGKVAMQDVETRGARHCRNRGLTARLVKTWLYDEFILAFRYECETPPKPAGA